MVIFEDKYGILALMSAEQKEVRVNAENIIARDKDKKKKAINAQRKDKQFWRLNPK